MIISVVIPVHNGSVTLDRCLEAVTASDYSNYEIIVVDDCSTDATSAIALRFGTGLVTLSGKPFGPAYARNRGADVAKGEVVLFIDADVIIPPDTLSKIALTFCSYPEYAATFGSYDEAPAEDDFLSQYKNLTHHFVHQQANKEAATFWSGCGAVRRAAFLHVGGFNSARYPQPSIEDIELGYRLRLSGYRICVNKEIQVKHLKRWTLKGWIKTDILDRAIPWTSLILSQRNLPNDLNLTKSQRLSALLALFALLYVAFRVPAIPIVSLLLLTIVTLLILSNWQLSEGQLFSRMSIRVELMIFLFLASTAGLSVVGDTPELLIPLGLILVVFIIRRAFTKPPAIFRRIVLGFLILALACSYGLLLFSSSWITGTVTCAILILITCLNAPLFLFFARRRDLCFSLATIPFHLMYYLYSLIAFAAGVGFYLSNMKWKSQRHYSPTL